jgi:hypothetical protein
MSIFLGTPVPRARFFKLDVPDYAQISVKANFFSTIPRIYPDPGTYPVKD